MPTVLTEAAARELAKDFERVNTQGFNAVQQGVVLSEAWEHAEDAIQRQLPEREQEFIGGIQVANEDARADVIGVIANEIFPKLNAETRATIGSFSEEKDYNLQDNFFDLQADLKEAFSGEHTAHYESLPKEAVEPPPTPARDVTDDLAPDARQATLTPRELAHEVERTLKKLADGNLGNDPASALQQLYQTIGSNIDGGSVAPEAIQRFLATEILPRASGYVRSYVNLTNMNSAVETLIATETQNLSGPQMQVRQTALQTFQLALTEYGGKMTTISSEEDLELASPAEAPVATIVEDESTPVLQLGEHAAQYLATQVEDKFQQLLDGKLGSAPMQALQPLYNEIRIATMAAASDAGKQSNTVTSKQIAQVLRTEIFPQITDLANPETVAAIQRTIKESRRQAQQQNLTKPELEVLTALETALLAHQKQLSSLLSRVKAGQGVLAEELNRPDLQAALSPSPGEKSTFSPLSSQTKGSAISEKAKVCLTAIASTLENIEKTQHEVSPENTKTANTQLGILRQSLTTLKEDYGKNNNALRRVADRLFDAIGLTPSKAYKAVQESKENLANAERSLGPKAGS